MSKCIPIGNLVPVSTPTRPGNISADCYNRQSLDFGIIWKCSEACVSVRTGSPVLSGLANGTAHAKDINGLYFMAQTLFSDENPSHTCMRLAHQFMESFKQLDTLAIISLRTRMVKPEREMTDPLRAIILNQVTNGLAFFMALIYLLSSRVIQ